MSSKRKRIDPNQLEMDFDQVVDEFMTATDSLLTAISLPKKSLFNENEIDLSLEIASACKRAQRAAGISREQLLDEINTYFGRTEDGLKADPPTCRPQLSIHMLNNYFSKPIEYPMPAHILVAIICITESLEPAQVIVDPIGARVITGSEIRQQKIGQLEEMKSEIRRLEKDLKADLKRS